MKLFLSKLGFISIANHEACELRRKKKRMMMTVEFRGQSEPKTTSKVSIEEAAICNTSNTSIGSSNNSSNNNNNNNSLIDSINHNRNIKSMPRHRTSKSVQNDSPSDKIVQANTDVSKSSRSQEERFYRNFPDLACSDDALIKTYHCALVTDILLQGYLYITSRWFCFYSKLFGKKKLIKIPLSLVLDVSKKKTAKFIPNAVGVTTLNKEYLFGSLLSRDNTYRVMCSAWHAYKTKNKESGSSPESEFSETNEELVSLDSHNTTANQSESTSYEESFSNVEEDTFDTNEVKLTDQLPATDEIDPCVYHAVETYKKTNKRCMFPIFEFIGYLLKMSSPSKTCAFLVVASILTIFLLISAFILSCQLSNLEVLFTRIASKTPPNISPTSPAIGDDDDLMIGDADDDNDIGDDSHNSCRSHKENLFLANLKEISTMHHQLLNQINKILNVLQRAAYNSSSSSSSSSSQEVGPHV